LFFRLIERLHSTINNLTLQYCTCSWHKALTVHRPKIVTVDFVFLIRSQITMHTENILHLKQCAHGHVWSWAVARFQKVRAGCEWFEKRNHPLWDFSYF
jgi:hypothetical protein